MHSYTVFHVDPYGRHRTDWTIVATSYVSAKRQAQNSYGDYGTDLDWPENDLDMYVVRPEEDGGPPFLAKEQLYNLAGKAERLAVSHMRAGLRTVSSELYRAQARVYTLIATGMLNLRAALVLADVRFREFRVAAHAREAADEIRLIPAKGKGSRPKKGTRFLETYDGEIPANAFEAEALKIVANVEAALRG